MTRPVNTILAISIIAVIATIAGGIIWWQMSQPAEEISPTGQEEQVAQQDIELAGWKTYTNEKYGFEFRYPEDHTLFSSISETEERLIPVSFESELVNLAEDESLVFCCESNVLKISVEQTNLGAQEWFNLNYQKYTDKIEIKSTKNIIFAGKDAIEMIGGGNLGSVYKLLVIQKDNYLIVISQGAQSDLLDKSLSTFKFVDTESTIGWKTWDRRNLEYYQSGEYFTIELPNDYKLAVVDKGWPYRIEKIDDYTKRIWIIGTREGYDIQFQEPEKGMTVRKIMSNRGMNYPAIEYEIRTSNEFECSECHYSPNSRYHGLQLEVAENYYYLFETKDDFGRNLFIQIISTFKFTK